MSDNLLLELLRAGLLEALGDDDQRRVRSEAAAAATGKWLGQVGRPHLASAVILAIDESSEPVGPVFDHAQECLLDEWPSFRNAFPERPNELLRAIILQGVEEAVDADSSLAAATWYVTRTVRDTSVSAGRWAAVVEAFMDDIDRTVNERLLEEWAPTMSDSKLRMPAIAVDDESSRMGSDSGLQAMKKFSAALGRDLRELLRQQSQIIEASRLRETLLWWRLAGWSELLDERYKQVEDHAKRVLAAAGDLHQLCPEVAPEAVEHLLADVVADSGPLDSEFSFDQLVEAWMDLSPHLELTHSAGPLISALSSGEQESLPPAMACDLTPLEVTVVAFRDLQTTRLTALVSDVESSS